MDAGSLRVETVINVKEKDPLVICVERGGSKEWWFLAIVGERGRNRVALTAVDVD